MTKNNLIYEITELLKDCSDLDLLLLIKGLLLPE